MSIDHLAELRAIKFAFILKTPLAKRMRDCVDLRRKSLTPNSGMRILGLSYHGAVCLMDNLSFCSRRLLSKVQVEQVEHAKFGFFCQAVIESS
jgi:hypothetical protein